MAIERQVTLDTGGIDKKLVDTTKNNVFAFWESDSEMPAYLKLCVETWYKNIPNCEIHIINYENINHYIQGVYNLDFLKKIPLAMQSDIISAAVLEKFGGLFLDIDSIVTDDLFKIFDIISTDRLIAFGNERKAIHIAVLYSRKPNNRILKEWRKGAQEKLESDISQKMDWDYFGNSIVEPFFTSPEYYKDCYIIERAISGNILEADAMKDYDATNLMKYRFFYFNKIFNLKPEVMSFIKTGVVSLHNSWTPVEIKNIKNIDDFIDTKMPIVDLLEYALSNEIKPTSSDTLVLIEAFIISELQDRLLDYKKRYYNGMLVLDFKINSIDFAFDICDENGLECHLIIRNKEDIERCSKIEGLFFAGNKAKLTYVSDKNKLIDSIIRIHDYYKNLSMNN